MAYEVVWYQSNRENSYEEFMRTKHVTLVDAFCSIIQEYGEHVVFDALTGIQSEVAWITDDLGFTIDRNGESWNRKS